MIEIYPVTGIVLETEECVECKKPGIVGMDVFNDSGEWLCDEHNNEYLKAELQKEQIEYDKLTQSIIN